MGHTRRRYNKRHHRVGDTTTTSTVKKCLKEVLYGSVFLSGGIAHQIRLSGGYWAVMYTHKHRGRPLSYMSQHMKNIRSTLDGVCCPVDMVHKWEINRLFHCTHLIDSCTAASATALQGEGGSYTQSYTFGKPNCFRFPTLTWHKTLKTHCHKVHHIAAVCVQIPL